MYYNVIARSERDPSRSISSIYPWLGAQDDGPTVVVSSASGSNHENLLIMRIKVPTQDDELKVVVSSASGSNHENLLIMRIKVPTQDDELKVVTFNLSGNNPENPFIL